MCHVVGARAVLFVKSVNAPALDKKNTICLRAVLRKRFVERTAAAVQLFNLDLFLVNVDCLTIGIVGKYLFSVQG